MGRQFVNSNVAIAGAGLLLLLSGLWAQASAQLLTEPPLPPKREHARPKPRAASLEWMWQYGPPPPGGREHEFIQDPHFRPFLEQNFDQPQSFWGLQPRDVQDPRRKSLPNTIDDFLTVPGTVTADENRYITVTGAVFHFASSRGLLFADLSNPQPLLAFAAIDWIRDSHTTGEAEAQYTLWIFTNRLPGPAGSPLALPPPLERSLARWLALPLAGSGIVQKIRAAILVGPNGIPHQVGIPARAASGPTPEAPQLPVRAPN